MHTSTGHCKACALVCLGRWCRINVSLIASLAGEAVGRLLLTDTFVMTVKMIAGGMLPAVTTASDRMLQQHAGASQWVL